MDLLLRINLFDCLSCVEYVDALILFEYDQVLISGDNGGGLGGEGASDDVIVVGIAHDARSAGRFDHFDDFHVIGEDVVRCFADGLEPLSEGGSCDDFGEFGEQGRAAKELMPRVLLPNSFQQLVRRTSPQQP